MPRAGSNVHSAPALIQGWVLICTLLSALGWLLSALGELNARGYIIGLLVCAAITAACLRTEPRSKTWSVQRFRRRFSRGFPLAYLVLAVLATLGGILYAPSNFDALAYRIPRVLHWLADGQWSWIQDYRGWLNTRACGFEWVTAPLLLFFKSDRLLFLINVISFLLLPGLIFSFFTRLGIRPRTAWYWMWLLPTAGAFLVQAGSIANDLYGAVLALAAVDFALRARTSGRLRDVWLSILAAAAMTNAKSSNLPLLLPWLIAILPSAKLVLSRPLATAAVACLALASSLLPISVLNQKYCGDWTGLAAEDAWMRAPNPLVCALHNAGLLGMQNLTPPIFPVAGAFNRAVQQWLPERWMAIVDSFAEAGRASYKIRELPGEEHAGLGVMLILLAVASAVCAWRSSRQLRPNWRWTVPLLVAPWLSLAVYMGKSAIYCPSRLLASYYALLLPIFLIWNDTSRVVRARWWRALAWLAVAVAFLAVILNPARPLFPALTALDHAAKHLPAGLVDRAKTVYTVYRSRPEYFAPIRNQLPPHAQAIALVSSTEAEASLWRPYGTRRVHRIRKGSAVNDLRDKQIEYVLLGESGAEEFFGMSVARWIEQSGASIITNFTLRPVASSGPADYFLVKVPSASQSTAQHASHHAD